VVRKRARYATPYPQVARGAHCIDVVSQLSDAHWMLAVHALPSAFHVVHCFEVESQYAPGAQLAVHACPAAGSASHVIDVVPHVRSDLQGALVPPHVAPAPPSAAHFIVVVSQTSPCEPQVRICWPRWTHASPAAGNVPHVRGWRPMQAVP
jgi:hypothetical protein